jgi:chaperonin cofactor prefoldin|tara:strand:+ start:91 stop:1377 length:1287 start_codon:yes stop_codon:yes gene_type:complete
MQKELQEVCDSLDELSNSIINGWNDDRTLNVAFGWNCPSLNRHDLAGIASKISGNLKNHNFTNIDEELLPSIEKIPEKIEEFKTKTLVYFYNGNAVQAVPVYDSLINWINSTLSPLFSWEVLYDTKAMPVKLSRRLSSLQTQLSDLIPEKESLEKQIKQIREATEAAESLPTDIASLKKARKTIGDLTTTATENKGLIDSHLKSTSSTVELIKIKKEETDKLVDKCEEAYRITTTKGLAASFDERAKKSQKSMYIWVTGLLLALGAGVYIGSIRFDSLLSALNASSPDWGVIWMNCILALLSLSAPLWFAWISTKQIGQRFKLAEDYSFKASVAKAYEGYRKEAARIDPAFEARLFSSALTRLEEAPLRLMEKDSHGSPWHELITSPQFEKAMNKIPELKDKFIQVSGNIIKTKPSKNGLKSEAKEEK